MPTILFWVNRLRLLVFVAAGLSISTAASSNSDTFKVSSDWSQSPSGQVSGFWNLGVVIRPTQLNRPVYTLKTVTLIHAKDSGFTEWELSQSDQQQTLQVLGRLNIGPLVGFFILNEAETFGIQDTRLTWFRAKNHDLSAHTRLYGSVGVSGHILKANYSGDDSPMGYALGFAPQFKAGLQTRWHNSLRTTLSVQTHKSLLLKHFKMQAHRFELQLHHPLADNADVSLGFFSKVQRYSYANVNKRIDFATATNGLSLTFEKKY
jgi:hypothetical protein